MSEKRINEALSALGKTPLWAADLKYQHVFDKNFNAPRNVQDIIGYDLDSVLALRAIAKNTDDVSARFRCIACDSPLVLLSTSDRSGFYFKHKYFIANCPIKDEKSLPQDVLRATKFNGKQESAAHEYMKFLLYHLLKLDPRFVNVDKEKVRKDSSSKEWKKPDVEGFFGGSKYVFEIQLATELLEVISKRRDFYIRNKTLLVWVFQAFSFDRARISDIDISYSNNNNIIVLDADAVEKTILTGRLHLSCHWREHCIENGYISYLHKYGIFDFELLNRNFEQSQIYHYNFIFEDRKVKQKLFTELWNADDISQYDDEKAAQIIKTCYGVHLEDKKNLARLIHLIWVARTGMPSGWSYTPEQVFHKLFDSYKRLIFIYITACQVYGRILPDKKGIIAEKTKLVLNDLATASPNESSPYYPKSRSRDIIRVIFPTLSQKLVSKLSDVCKNK
jgi:hypothetical protein